MTNAVPDTHDMVVIHRIFRREFRLLADLVRRAPAGDTPRAANIAEHLEFTLTALHYHHSTEDEYLWPRLLERAQPQAELVHRMQGQHEVVAGSSEHARRLLQQWRSDPTAALGRELAATLTRLSDALAEHLDEEEAHILPLVRDHLTVAEWEEVGRQSFDKFPRSAMPIMVGQMLEVATATDRDLFFGKLPPPARVMWRLVGQRRYARYIRRVRGVPPGAMHPALKSAMRTSTAAAVWLYRRTNGRVGGTAKGLPLLLLTVPGRKTGTPRTVAVACFRHDGGYVVIGSAGGMKNNPQWIGNLRAAGWARIQLGGEEHDVDARVTEGTERDDLWAGVVLARAPFFSRYQEKSGRVIPIAVLHPRP
ncbi:nitroreductase/quinone reductase family protein [Sphaerisporangium sp. NPDC088356]|uniref:nitroreductase/quinone reductase family protein n=1 Tax=Sphaerisporangium sp. NPDC088356 TaxID=3154871 RepID=UPI003429F4D8